MTCPVSVDDGREKRSPPELKLAGTAQVAVSGTFFAHSATIHVEKRARDRHARRQEPCLVRDHTAPNISAYMDGLSMA